MGCEHIRGTHPPTGPHALLTAFRHVDERDAGRVRIGVVGLQLASVYVLRNEVS